MQGFLCALSRTEAPIPDAVLDRLESARNSARLPNPAICEPRAWIAADGPATDLEDGTRIFLHGNVFRSGSSIQRRKEVQRSPLREIGQEISRGGYKALGDCAGSFIIFSFNKRDHQLCLVTDQLGSRKLYFTVWSGILLVASRIEPIFSILPRIPNLNQSQCVRFLGLLPPVQGESFFEQIIELKPGYLLKARQDKLETTCYWRFDITQHRRVDESSASDLFLQHIKDSYRCEMDESDNKAGLSLSGGLDSLTLATLSAENMPFFSWRFSGAADNIESLNIQQSLAALGRNTTWLDADGIESLDAQFFERYAHKGSPHINAFSELKSRLYTLAQQNGCSTMVVGDGGDSLYGAADYWLRDLFRDQPVSAFSALGNIITQGGIKQHLGALRLLLPGAGIRRSRRLKRGGFLTDTSLDLIKNQPEQSSAYEAGATDRIRRIFNPRLVELEAEEHQFFSRIGVNRCNPLWSWPLIEFVLQLPAYQLQDACTRKKLMRKCLRGSIPDAVVDSPRIGQLGHYFLGGIESRRSGLRDILFRDAKSDWSRYINPTKIEQCLDNTDSIQPGHTILWRVICYEAWIRTLTGYHTHI